MLLAKSTEQCEGNRQRAGHDDKASGPDFGRLAEDDLLVTMEWKASAGTATYTEISTSGSMLALVTRPNRYPTMTTKNVGPMMFTIWCIAAGYTGCRGPPRAGPGSPLRLMVGRSRWYKCPHG